MMLFTKLDLYIKQMFILSQTNYALFGKLMQHILTTKVF